MNLLSGRSVGIFSEALEARVEGIRPFCKSKQTRAICGVRKLRLEGCWKTRARTSGLRLPV